MPKIGYKQTLEHKHKLSIARKGRPISQEQIAKLVASHKGVPSLLLGTHIPEERKHRISETMKGCIPWNKGIKTGSSGFKGKLHTKEVRVKISQAHTGKSSGMKGKHISEEHKQKISVSNKGRTISEKHKKSISIASKGKILSIETKGKISEQTKGKHKGEQSPNWKGGISFLPYCSKFNRQIKKAVRDRDNHICQLCGIEENRRKLDVHHIHYDKSNCYPDLITLCRNCNVKANFNHQYYEQFLMNNLNNRKLLFWTQRTIKDKNL